MGFAQWTAQGTLNIYSLEESVFNNDWFLLVLCSKANDISVSDLQFLFGFLKISFSNSFIMPSMIGNNSISELENLFKPEQFQIGLITNVFNPIQL